jgi:SAM-dependent methyltransferase
MSTPPWSKEVEAGYFAHIAPEALTQSLTKPFSTSNRASLLIEIGAVISLLPEPPARVVDLGCGTGWTSAFLARCGYDVVGTDLSPEAVTAAQSFYDDVEVTYVVHDFDQPLPDDVGRFAAAVFFDCLHHSADEARPLRTAFLALKPGGICVVCEPGRGHADSETSLAANRMHGVRERDMPPTSVVAAGRAAGFARSEVFPHPQELARNVYFERDTSNLRQRLLASRAGEVVRLVRAVTIQRKHWGLVRLSKA